MQENIIENILDPVFQYAWHIAFFFIVFSLLAKLMPCNKDQPLIRKGLIVDLLYGLVIPVLSQYVFIFYLAIGFGIFFYSASQDELSNYLANGHGYLSTLPIWIQAAIVFILSDILLYWLHRLFHGPKMWKFHAVHHSSKVIDFLSSQRFHPINSWLSFTLVNALMIIIGFSPQSISMMGSFNVAYSYMVHANLNWTFGPFCYLFASPVFHRWHHTTQKEGLDKNFAPTFPLLDIMFGTYYMPKGKLPEQYGITGVDMPESFSKQIIWPFYHPESSGDTAISEQN